jgi:hypothetical protein
LALPLVREEAAETHLPENLAYQMDVKLSVNTWNCRSAASYL